MQLGRKKFALATIRGVIDGAMGALIVQTRAHRRYRFYSDDAGEGDSRPARTSGRPTVMDAAPLEASVSKRVPTRCVRIVPLPVRFQRIYQADPATAQGGRTRGGVRWLASCTPRSRACGADIDSATRVGR